MLSLWNLEIIYANLIYRFYNAPYLHLTYSKCRSNSNWGAVQVHQHKKPTKSEGKARSNKCDLSSLLKAPKEFADLAPKCNKFNNLVPATKKQESKCF